MLWIAAAALAASTPPIADRMHVQVQARATVRIVSAARIRFHGKRDRDVPPIRHAVIHMDGRRHPAELVEFE